MRALLQFFTIAVILIYASEVLDAQEWTRFRGPNGSGKAKAIQLPDEISAMDYDWIINLDGYGHSSPVLWKNRLFLTLTNDNGTEGTQRTLVCFDSENGKTLWQWTDPLAGHNLHKFNNFASSTPTVDQDRVYLVWGSGTETQAIALTHEGELEWRKSWPGFTSDHGHGASPVLIDGVLVFHTDSKDEYKSYVIGLSPESGEILWDIERVTPASDKKHFTAYNTPIAVKAGSINTVVALQSNDGWKGIDPKSGNVIWSAPGGYRFRSVGSVVGEGPYLFASFGSGGGGKQASLIKVGSNGAEVKYSLGIKDGLSYVPTSLIHEGNLYLWGDGGILTCRDLETGEEKYKTRIGGNFFSSPILIGDRILCASLDGDLVMVNSGDEFELISKSQLSSGVHATPAVANNCLFVRTDTHLICIPGAEQ